jgi:hypothetical protein
MFGSRIDVGFPRTRTDAKTEHFGDFLIEILINLLIEEHREAKLPLTLPIPHLPSMHNPIAHAINSPLAPRYASPRHASPPRRFLSNTFVWARKIKMEFPSADKY